ncbi:MAG: response regulator transcription factor [candidate division WOR-3 bacterium]|jgi:two-component system phosphate regulon response regulator PhoB/two-component system alkaline phosphatase synthesis response regulator PhoP|nr:response regulator transcription factor [candidate division WOR-3 bacterium]MDH7519065.1 response regulator transcription factor [bacterium]
MANVNSSPDKKQEQTPLSRTRLIAIVDDEPDILELLSLHLTKSGFSVQKMTSGAELYQFLEKTIPHLIILDLMLPDVDGIDICRFLKQEPRFASIPIIMLTARGEESDRITGLELGADDYITKPFSPKEVVARVRAVLRRQEQITADEKITVGTELVIYPKKHEVTAAGRKIDLTATEFRILMVLAAKPGWVFTREQIIDELWGYDKPILDRTIDVHIQHLRKKMGKAGELIRNIRGVGYKLEL